MTEDFRVKDVLSLCVDWNSISSTRAAVDQFVDAFLSLTRDISHGGISLLCTEEIKAPYLLLRMEMARYRCLQAVVRVIRSRTFYQFNEVSAAFVLCEENNRSSATPKKSKASGRRGTKAESGRRQAKKTIIRRKPARAL